jgi:hypothetical protein
MIIWTGGGIVIGIVGFTCLLFTNLGVNALLRDSRYYETHGWPKLLGLWLAAAASWWVGRRMTRGRERQVKVPEPGQLAVVESGDGDSFFFIPVQYWWVVFLAPNGFSAIFR